MDKRYQVFVSSTFDDLRDERSAVISALLQLDCFPAGMEMFPAADDDSLTLIKSVIDDSDYYLVVVAGRYGSQPLALGQSYTHLEYEYALSIGKPTIALLHSNPGLLPADKTERSDEGRRRLDEFREILKKKNCRYWADRGELISAVFTGIQHLKRTRQGVGWIRGSELPDEHLKDELLRFRREIDFLNEQLFEAKARAAPPNSEELAQGSDVTTLNIDLDPGDALTTSTQHIWVRWNEIMRAVLPQTLGGGADARAIASALASLLHAKTFERTLPCRDHPGWGNAVLSRGDFGKVLNQPERDPLDSHPLWCPSRLSACCHYPLRQAGGR